MISISQGVDRYKVPMVGKNGKLNETIEMSTLWSIWQSQALFQKIADFATVFMWTRVARYPTIT